MEIKAVTQEGELVILLLQGQASSVRIVFKVPQPSIRDYPNLAHLLQSLLSAPTEVVDMVEY